MWLYLKNHSFFFTQENLSVLHMAPEQCFVDRFKAQKNLNYLTADLVSPIADLHFDLHQIPLEKDRFDVVFCNHVMEHVADPVQCMSELFRVLKPGGWAIMQVPQDFTRESTFEDPSIISEADREQHYWQKDHVRLFGKDYPTYAERVGFQTTAFDLNAHYSREEIECFRLMKNEVLYIFKKPNP
jgi:SAM-dependent methyltransferase